MTTPNPLPRPSQITEWMKPGDHYQANNLSKKFGCKVKEMTPILRGMVEASAINTVVIGNLRSYYIPLPVVIDPNLPVRYIATWSPLTDYTAKQRAFMAGCMAIRR
ncbi:MAG: hypothetical protein JWP38_3724 [Herbaspirillum sp.]|nr:hypothetical protein [Herbaspirillum sp.]